MIGFQRPELLLLVLPAAWLLWRTRDRQVGTNVLRALALALVGLALAGAYLNLQTPGRDLVVVVDRSRSMTEESAASIVELLRLAEEQRERGDRVALVTFGAEAAIERPPSEEARFDAFTREVQIDGSDVAAALDAALELIPEGRAGSILLLSDGEVRGRDPLAAARRAFARNVHIDVRPFTRPIETDLAVERIDVPELAASGEPFQFSAWVRTDRSYSARYELERNGEVIVSGERSFTPGTNRIVFRDAIERVGVARYTLNVLGVEDRIPENNFGQAALRIDGPRRLLVVNYDGAEDSLVLALRRSGLNVDVSAPETAPIDRIGLEAYRGVILENVEAGRLGKRMKDLRRFVEERGGGLLVTGGRASFGVGGYYLSPLDPVLPISMELRKEQRKQGMALAIAMDRSGSMGAAASGGTKMDLANMAAASAIELLSNIDAVSVMAVDTEADVVQPMTTVDDTAALAARVLRISPGGGGIYVRNALEAAVRELNEATQLSKHITLFSDAADSEQQEGCVELATQLSAAGVTLSVIALGTTADTDADFLRALAAAGQGDCYFTTEAEELPRLFAQDTLTASRSAFIDQPTPVRVLSDLYAMGQIPSETFPTIGGYNLTYLRDGANAGLVGGDENTAPIFAFWYQGLGRSAVYTGQIGGSFGADIVAWEDFSAWFVTVSRWLLGTEPPDAVFGRVYREGREAVVRVEVDPAAEIAADLSEMEALLGRTDANADRRPFQRLSADLYEARFPLDEDGIVLPTVKLDERRSLRLAPLALPYSPEFEPSPDPKRGERLLRRLARESGGEVTPATTALFRGERGGRAWRPVTRELLLAALVVLLFEILFRRLSLWSGALFGRGERTSAEERAAESAALRSHRSPIQPADAAGNNEAATDKTAPLAGHAKLADALRRARGRARRETGR